MTDLPPEAVTAAAVAIRKRWAMLPEPFDAGALAIAALEAAAPHIAAAERERLRTEMPTGVIRIEGGELSEAEVSELAEKFRAAWRKGDYTILPDDTGERIAKAVAAQRERDAQLAEQHRATYPVPWDNGERHPLGETKRRPFAALLRQGHAAGGGA